MKVRRAVALGAVALATAACSGGVAVPPTTSGSTVTTSGPTSTVATAPTATVTGSLALAGGPVGACGIQDLCLQKGTISFEMGTYVLRVRSKGRFRVTLTPGVYRVEGTPNGNRRPCETKRLVVKAGSTSSVRLWCQIP